MDPSEAFKVDVERLDDDTLRARFRIHDCCYLYKKNMRFDQGSAGASPKRLQPEKLPAGKIKRDEFFGDTEVYYGDINIEVPLNALDSSSQKSVLDVHYQGCSEKGVAVCYPPSKQRFEIYRDGEKITGIKSLGRGDASAPDVILQAKDGMPTQRSSMPDFSASTRSLTAWLGALFGAFFAGVALSFTACVLPMIPILFGVVAGQNPEHLSKWRGGSLAATYVLGTSVTYTAAGVLAGLTGQQLQAYFQNPWALGLFATFIVLMALAMFGVFTFEMPVSIQTRLQVFTRRFKGGSYGGVFLLGLFSALIIGACVSPFLGAILAAAMQKHDPVFGGALMFVLAWGMGTLLIAIGLGGGWLLPKAGVWMDKIRVAMGIMLLAVAIYLLSFIPQVPVLYLWAGLLIMTGVYLGATQSVGAGASGWRWVAKGVGTLSLIWGILALIGAMAGNRDPLHPLPLSKWTAVSSNATQGAATSFAHFKIVNNVMELDAALLAAKEAKRPVVFDYYAEWCIDCERLHRGTFSDPRVMAQMQRFVLLQADVTAQNDNTQTLKQRFSVYGPPAVLFFSPSGQELKQLHFYGHIDPEPFIALLKQAAAAP